MFDSIITNYIVRARQCWRGDAGEVQGPIENHEKSSYSFNPSLRTAPTMHISGLKTLGVRGYSFNRHFRRPPQNFLPGETCGRLSGGRKDR